jgi:hypothetical protein
MEEAFRGPLIAVDLQERHANMNATVNPSVQNARKVRRFEASVSYATEGEEHEEPLPIYAPDYDSANRMAFAYVLQVMKLQEFELRIVGA